LTRSVPAGSHTDFIGPLPRIWIVPRTEPSAKIRPAPREPSKQL
jgi:hypothetical protein